MEVQPSSPSGEMQPQIKIGRVESINLYQVKESELETLETGGIGSKYRCLALLSGVRFLVFNPRNPLVTSD